MTTVFEIDGHKVKNTDYIDFGGKIGMYKVEDCNVCLDGKEKVVEVRHMRHSEFDYKTGYGEVSYKIKEITMQDGIKIYIEE